MSVYKTEAIVLGAKNWGEADKMLTLFTLERGIVKAAAFGARRPRSPIASGTQMFRYIEVQLAEGARVDTVKSCTLKAHYKKLSSDLTAMAYGAFVAEVLREFLPEGAPEPALFTRLTTILAAFETRNPRVTAVAAAYQLMEFTGLQLHYEHCLHCGREIIGDAAFSIAEGGAICAECAARAGVPLEFSAALREFIVSLRDFDWRSSLTVRGALLTAAENILLSHLQSLLGRPLKSLEFLRQL